MIQVRLSLQIGDILRADFRTSLQADAENSRIQKLVGYQYRYQPARIAIALSLRETSLPAPLHESNGRPIKGDTLFGADEADLISWVALVVQRSNTVDMTRKEFQETIAMHWDRGIHLLKSHVTAEGHVESMVENLLKSASMKKSVVYR